MFPSCSKPFSVDSFAHFKEFESQHPRISLEDQKTLVWRFPLNISQSSICGKTKLSNACTLIALKIAELVHNHNVEMPKILDNNKINRASGGSEIRQRNFLENKTQLYENERNISENNKNINIETICPDPVLLSLINGIVDGNEIYSKDAGTDSNRVYNLPDAIRACGGNFREVDFKLCTSSISIALPKMIQLAVKCRLFSMERRLTFVVIGCVRTVLIIYDRNLDSLTLFDTHMHLWHDQMKNENIKHGAIIATCSLKDLKTFGKWIQSHVFPDITKSTMEFEISLIQLAFSHDLETQQICKSNPINLIDKRTAIFNIDDNGNVEYDEEKKKDYPLLRNILSIGTPLKMLRRGEKRRNDSKNGLEECCFVNNDESRNKNQFKRQKMVEKRIY